MPIRIEIAYLAVLLAGLATTARADLTVSFQTENPTIPTGGTETIGVYVSSSADAGSPDLVNFFQITLGIDQVSGPNGFLQFSPSPSADYVNRPDYIFSGISSGPFPDVSGPNFGTFQVSDSSLTLTDDYNYGNGDPVALSTASGRRLLASIQVVAPTNQVSVGDVFQIGLISDQSFFQLNDFSMGTVVSDFTFGSSPAGVTITQAAVPEPATNVTALTGALLMAAYGWVHVRGPRPQGPRFI
jgi:hypothetical protein